MRDEDKTSHIRTGGGGSDADHQDELVRLRDVAFRSQGEVLTLRRKNTHLHDTLKEIHRLASDALRRAPE